MKFNKIFMIMIGLAVVLSLTACKNNVQTENQIDNNGEGIVSNNSGDKNDVSNLEFSGDLPTIGFESQFKEEIKNYATYMNNIKLFLESDNEEAYIEYGVSQLLKHLKDSADPFSALSYTRMDLNKDGVDEILLFDDTSNQEYKNVIISMLSISGDTSYNILNSQENMLYRLYENNVIGAEYPDVACFNFFELDENMNFITLDSVDATTSSGDVKTILDKYKEAELDLEKVK